MPDPSTPADMQAPEKKITRLAVLLPCDTIENLALDRPSAEAHELLTAWTAMWHPSLLLATRETPGWESAHLPPNDFAGRLFVLPECSRAMLPDGWLEGHDEQTPCVIPAGDNRSQLISALLAAVEPPPVPDAPQLVDEFLAIGFCYFLVELLTRQLRYMSNLDEASFRSELIAAADEAGKGNAAEARRRLQLGFDRLGDAREYFYPIESRLLDLTLVAPTTLGQSLQATLAETSPINLLLTGNLVERLATEHPDTLTLLKEGIEKKRVGLVGGEYEEAPLPLLPPEAIRFHLERGLAAFEQHLGHRPKVYGRRQFGLTPLLPPILRQLGFKAAMHFTLDDGRFPSGNQSRVQWQGVDGRSFDAAARLPLDVSRPECFLRLAERLGDVMDLDHTATATFAHWPGAACQWYDDLRRAARSARVLGSFATVDEYFDQTAMSGQAGNYTPDQYHAPYLRQAVAAGEPNPISRWVAYYRNRTMLDAVRALEAFLACTSGRIDVDVQPRLELETALVEQAHFERSEASADAELESALARAAHKLAESLGFRAAPRTSADCATATRASTVGEAGVLLLNPLASDQRPCLPWPDEVNLPATVGAVRAAGGPAGSRVVVADVPAMGFTFVGASEEESQPEAEPQPQAARGWLQRKPKPKIEPPMAEELEDRLVLRNGRCEVVFDKFTGVIRGINDYRTRGPRLAQQLALRLPDSREEDPADEAHYTISAADSWQVTAAGPLVGEIVCRGRLMSREGNRMAGFQQTTRLWRGSRIIQIEIELEPDTEPGSNPWNSYYAVRFAWNDATANLYRSVGQLNHPTDANLLEAPYFVDVRTPGCRTTLLSNGLPYHRRFGLRRLDTLLRVRGETATKFRLGIGIDVPHPLHAALGEMLPPVVLPVSEPPSATGGWLFHVDHRNVLVTYWEPLPARPPEPKPPASDSTYDSGYDDYWEPEGIPPTVPAEKTDAAGEEASEPEPIDPTQLAGLRIRLLETDGRATRVGLRVLRPVAKAEKVTGNGRPPSRLDLADDCITVPLGAHEWAEIEVWFAPPSSDNA